ncbi:uncharacterized protein LOC119746319 [Patiria miniata]|uniref:Uncharacterized protein n=1 Tax=Patiria miniata TaxID=46514 RepID=A0A914BS56_PATMI|nr:uncharacterized protein LOC119746319 [Patiria miniata]
MAAVNLLAELLLDPAVTLGPFDTFPQFQELFPPKYRDHPDARLLYRAFQRQRRIVREKVAKDIQRRYKQGLHGSMSMQGSRTTENQSLEETVHFLEDKQAEVEEELKATRQEIGTLEEAIHSLSSRLEKSKPTGPLSLSNLNQLEELKGLAATLRDPT